MSKFEEPDSIQGKPETEIWAEGRRAVSMKRSAAQLGIDEKTDILQAVRSVAGSEFRVGLMIAKKAKEHAVHEDTIRLVVMSAAMVLNEQTRHTTGPKGSEL